LKAEDLWYNIFGTTLDLSFVWIIWKSFWIGAWVVPLFYI